MAGFGSEQKSVSVMCLFDKRLIEAHRRSVAFAMKELERFAAVRIRSGANVNTQNYEVTGNIVYASFQHDISRLLDPQRHTHNEVCNVTKTKDGIYKVLENFEICRAIRYCAEFTRICLLWRAVSSVMKLRKVLISVEM